MFIKFANSHDIAGFWTNARIGDLNWNWPKRPSLEKTKQIMYYLLNKDDTYYL
jgi:hypothetical protein